jgi:hypothetical protein
MRAALHGRPLLDPVDLKFGYGIGGGAIRREKTRSDGCFDGRWSFLWRHKAHIHTPCKGRAIMVVAMHESIVNGWYGSGLFFYLLDAGDYTVLPRHSQ